MKGKNGKFSIGYSDNFSFDSNVIELDDNNSISESSTSYYKDTSDIQPTAHQLTDCSGHNEVTKQRHNPSWSELFNFERRTDESLQSIESGEAIANIVRTAEVGTQLNYEEHEPYSIPEKRLWKYVLYRAIADVLLYPQRDERRKSAIRWFQSEITDEGSFSWICDKIEIPNRGNFLKIINLVIKGEDNDLIRLFREKKIKKRI